MLQLTDNARTVLESRYLREGETPEGLFRRVAKAISDAGKKWGDNSAEDEFYDLLTSLRFLPNTPTLANAGTPGGQLSACFVLPVPDTMPGIFDTAKHMAIIQKSGGGTGFAFSNLRPNGAKVGEYGGSACGPLPFMEIYDQISSTVRQGGMRHGANMGILRVDHPDIMDFIRMKRGGKTLTNFNISVGATDDFMVSVKEGDNFPLIDHVGSLVRSVPAREIFDAIVDMAWECGDPGLVFLDRINEGRSNPVPMLGPIQATNPCGEQPLYPYDSCNLGSIDLSKHYNETTGQIDWTALRETTAKAVAFLDNVIEANHYPLPEIEKMSKGIRRIGLGVMGWADLLYKMLIPYNSDEAVRLGEKVMDFIQGEADIASYMLAKTRGPFPRWQDSIYNNGIEWEKRNSTRTTIAPTGTISILAGCSSGIEPVFALAFRRQHKLDKSDANRNVEMFEVNPVFKKVAEANGVWTPEMGERLARGESLKNFSGVPAWVAKVFVTAHEIDPIDHLRMQAAFQRHTDNAVSKTINFRRSADRDEIAKAYMAAWEMDLKGITVYRDGSREGQVLSATPAPTQTQTEDTSKITDFIGKMIVPGGDWVNTSPRRKLGKTRQAVTHKFRVGEHNGYLTVGLYPEGTPGELFIKLNRQGHALSGFADGTCMAVSIGLQHGVPLETFVKKYKNTKFEPSGMTDDPEIRHCTSILDYVFRWMELRYLGEPVEENEPGESCPCGGYFVYEEGCLKCHSCGSSQC